MEHAAEREAFKKLTETMGLQRKVKRGDAWFPITTGKAFYNSLNQYVIEVFRNADEDTDHNFEYGKPLMFFSINGDKPHYYNISANVSYVDGNRMLVVLPSADSAASLMQAEGLGVQLSFDETSYRAMFDALDRVIRAKNGRLAYLRDLFASKVPAATFSFSDISLPWLNATQQNAVNEVLRAKDVAIVHGPPGTGKSRTIVNLVAHLIASGKTVLVASRMDKAVDVVADRLNELGAPFLALRAGRANYQKQLNFQLQDLLSGKVDLDTDFDDAIFTDVKDMKELLNNISESEQKAEKIIKLEQQWHNFYEEKQKQEKISGQSVYIKRPLKRAEIDQIKNTLNLIEKNAEKTGFLANIINFKNKNTLKKILGTSSFAQDYESLGILRDELAISEIDCDMRTIEASIQKLGNLHVILEQIRSLKKKRKTLAVDILKNKRRDALQGLLRDQVKRQRLIIHSKSLVERKQNLQNRLLENEDFKPLLEAFPCWCVTTYAVSGSLPQNQDCLMWQ